MALITGTLKRISQNERSFTDKKTGQPKTATAYGLGVQKDGESELTWIGAGFKSPGVREESRVAIMATQNAQGYWNCKPEQIEVLDAGPTPQAPSQPTQSTQAAPAAAQSRPQSPNDRQASITLQSSFNYAINFVTGLVSSGVIKPAMNSAAKKEAAQDMIWDMTKRYAAEMHEYFNDPEGFKESVLSSIRDEAVDEADDDMFGDD